MVGFWVGSFFSGVEIANFVLFRLFLPVWDLFGTCFTCLVPVWDLFHLSGAVFSKILGPVLHPASARKNIRNPEKNIAIVAARSLPPTEPNSIKRNLLGANV